jgi:hypothetical protein
MASARDWLSEQRLKPMLLVASLGSISKASMSRNTQEVGPVAPVIDGKMKVSEKHHHMSFLLAYHGTTRRRVLGLHTNCQNPTKQNLVLFD